MLIEIPHHIEVLLERQAKAQGISMEQVAQNVLAKQLQMERPFNFDLDELQQSIDSGFVEVPNSATQDFESFDKWLEGRFA